jgi:hypothetical protein
MLLKCPCGKHFPFNPSKHEQDEFIYSPCCKLEVKNPEFKPGTLAQFNPRWIAEKIKKFRERRALINALDWYFPKNPMTDRRAFSIGKWDKGKRPSIPLIFIVRKVGTGQNAVDEEVKRLQDLGFIIPQEQLFMDPQKADPQYLLETNKVTSAQKVKA